MFLKKVKKSRRYFKNNLKWAKNKQRNYFDSSSVNTVLLCYLINVMFYR